MIVFASIHFSKRVGYHTRAHIHIQTGAHTLTNTRSLMRAPACTRTSLKRNSLILSKSVCCERISHSPCPSENIFFSEFSESLFARYHTVLSVDRVALSVLVTLTVYQEMKLHVSNVYVHNRVWVWELVCMRVCLCMCLCAWVQGLTRASVSVRMCSSQCVHT